MRVCVCERVCFKIRESVLYDVLQCCSDVKRAAIPVCMFMCVYVCVCACVCVYAWFGCERVCVKIIEAAMILTHTHSLSLTHAHIACDVALSHTLSLSRVCVKILRSRCVSHVTYDLDTQSESV